MARPISPLPSHSPTSSPAESKSQPCPLCASLECPPFGTLSYSTAEQKVPMFYRCETCELIFKTRQLWLEKEKAFSHYVRHNNDLSNEGYLNFLSRLVTPVLALLEPGMLGLDFGCGPTKGIELLFSKLGHRVNSYDISFFPEESLLSAKYHFITCSEVAEHFTDPRSAFLNLRNLLADSATGILGIMTQLAPEEFDSWWYHRDPTHVVFYSPKTMEWIGRFLDLKLNFHPNNVMIFSNRHSRRLSIL